MDEGLRVVCDRLDALVTVCGAVLYDRDAELLADDDSSVMPLCLTRPAITGQHGKIESQPAEDDEDVDREYVYKLQTENRQLFDELVEIMRHIDETDVPTSADPRHSSPASKEQISDTGRISDSTKEANSSRASSYTTGNEFSSGSTSPNTNFVRSVVEKNLRTDFTPEAEEADVNPSDDDSDTATEEVNKPPNVMAEDGKAPECWQQTYKSALELLDKQKTLLVLQQRSNAKLQRELVELSGRNRTLQTGVTKLKSSVDRRNSEVASLTETADELSRLIDEQVEEFRSIFRAVTLDNDNQLEALATENCRLKSELASICERGSTEKKSSQCSQGDGSFSPSKTSDSGHNYSDYSSSAADGADPVLSAPAVISSPFSTLSAICLERPLVVDLITVQLPPFCCAPSCSYEHAKHD